MESVDNLLSSIIRSNILVVGDVMLDRYWFGDVDRISPEAPVPVVSVNDVQERLGGAGNVSLNMASLGGSSTLLGIIGDDQAGQSIRKLSAVSSVQHSFVEDGAAPTTVKQRIISRNQQLLRADFESPPHADTVKQLTEEAGALVARHDALVISDYGKGATAEITKLIALAAEQGIPVLVDPKGAEFERYRGATMITPNLKEFELVVGEINGEEDMDSKAAGILSRYDIGHLLVTLSEKGMKLFSPQSPPLHSPARSREVYDVSGAGDTVIAVMAMCMAAKVKMVDALQIANCAAGVVISKLGTATSSLAELKTAILRGQRQ